MFRPEIEGMEEEGGEAREVVELGRRVEGEEFEGRMKEEEEGLGRRGGGGRDRGGEDKVGKEEEGGREEEEGEDEGGGRGRDGGGEEKEVRNEGEGRRGEDGGREDEDNKADDTLVWSLLIITSPSLMILLILLPLLDILMQILFAWQTKSNQNKKHNHPTPTSLLLSSRMFISDRFRASSCLIKHTKSSGQKSLSLKLRKT